VFASDLTFFAKGLGVRMLASLLADQGWLEQLASSGPRAAEILSRPADQQQSAGYFHTLREICQQPTTWIKTAELMIASAAELRTCVQGVQSLVLTGSGSSEFAGDCVLSALKRELGMVAEVIGGGALLTYGANALPPGRPALVVSIARSGDSPESVGAVARLMDEHRNIRHLVLTCNRDGRLADVYREDAGVHVIALDDATNDRSLVMTSSFTNLVLAARSLGLIDAAPQYRATTQALSAIASDLLRKYFGTISSVAASGFRRAAYLGTGPRLGAARESALKMLEMTAGSVATLCDSYLGFRHGPMSFAHQDTLIVCFLSSDPLLRAYEADLLQELNDKELGLLKVIVGQDVPQELVRSNDVVIECPGLAAVGDDNCPVIHVLVGQLLAFFRCLEEGLHPDSPSADGVINRVVQSFKLHVPGSIDAKATFGNGRKND
jgi:tagatose-6-phosphate ketose/aldose isomerase